MILQPGHPSCPGLIFSYSYPPSPPLGPIFGSLRVVLQVKAHIFMLVVRWSPWAPRMTGSPSEEGCCGGSWKKLDWQDYFSPSYIVTNVEDVIFISAKNTGNTVAYIRVIMTNRGTWSFIWFIFAEGAEPCFTVKMIQAVKTVLT